MDQTQRKYARQRATEIRDTKYAALVAKFTDEGVKLTNEEKIVALATKEYTVRSDNDGYYGRGDWYYRIKFNAERPRATNQKELDAAKKNLNSKFDALIDELMLGDNEEARTLLAAFEASA